MQVAVTKPLNIGCVRKCKCPDNKINCLTAKEWVQSQVAVWEFYHSGRDVRDKKIHPAVFPIGLPTKCIQLFTHEGELVLDPFSGEVSWTQEAGNSTPISTRTGLSHSRSVAEPH